MDKFINTTIGEILFLLLAVFVTWVIKETIYHLLRNDLTEPNKDSLVKVQDYHEYYLPNKMRIFYIIVIILIISIILYLSIFLISQLPSLMGIVIVVIAAVSIILFLPLPLVFAFGKITFRDNILSFPAREAIKEFKPLAKFNIKDIVEMDEPVFSQGKILKSYKCKIKLKSGQTYTLDATSSFTTDFLTFIYNLYKQS